jgi:hypothetical protein
MDSLISRDTFAMWEKVGECGGAVGAQLVEHGTEDRVSVFANLFGPGGAPHGSRDKRDTKVTTDRTRK